MALARYLIVRFIRKRSICGCKLDAKSFKLEAKSLFPVFFLAYMIDTTFYTVLKIVYQDGQIVGRDLAMTIVGSLLPIFAQVGLVFYSFVVMKFLKSYVTTMGNQKRVTLERKFNILSRLTSIIPLTSVVFSVMPLFGLPYPEHQYIFSKIFLIGTGANAWAYGILTGSALSSVLHELKSHVFPQSSDDIRVVKWRLTFAFYVIVCNSFLIGAASTVFGLFDFLMELSTYKFLFDLLFCPVGATVLILTVSKISKEGKDGFSAITLNKVPKKILFLRRSSSLLNFLTKSASKRRGSPVIAIAVSAA